MAYRALLTFTYDTAAPAYDNIEYQRMESALLALGWRYSETTAFVYDQTDEPDQQAMIDIWQGIAVVGRASAAVGPLTSLSYVVQQVNVDPDRTNFGNQNGSLWLPRFQSRVFPGDHVAGNSPPP